MGQKQERLKLGEQERDRLEVLYQVETGHLKQREAVQQLGLSERGLRKLLARYRNKGDQAVMHGLRGRASNRRLSSRQGARAVALVKAHYRDFGPTLASECLAERHGLVISRETLRQLLVRAGLWEAHRRKLTEVHVWRPRRSCVGELLQWDTSVHAWLEERGPSKMYLIAGIDDASSRLFARFVEADSSQQHMRVLWAYLERYGRPRALYTDRASVFQPSLAPGWQEQEPGPKTETQMGRALRELGIEWIAAHSPQAKGRIERCFGTLQQRLVKALRLAGIRTLKEANAFLEERFLPEWNQRFTRQPAHTLDAHRELTAELELASVLARVEERKVGNSYTVPWDGQTWRLPKEAIRAGLRGRRIRTEQRLDGTMMARVDGQFFALSLCAEPPLQKSAPTRSRKRFVPPPGQSRWMNGFRVGNKAAVATSSAPLRSPSGFPSRG
ncbi:MAG: ISNCY family transposase [Acidobacteriales bacterium]|nr:ISNCY family transposase [Terriglobales bacterium]